MALAAIPFNANIPVATNSPSQDVNNMTANTNSENQIWGTRDHIGFGVANSGLHSQVQIQNAGGTNGTIPVGLSGNGFETLYSSVTAGFGELWFVRGATATGIQLTGPGTPAWSVVAGPPQIGQGYTFLPGGMILQWGFYVKSTALGNTTNVVFSQNFPNNIFFVIAQPYVNNPANLLSTFYGTDGGTAGLGSNFNFQLASNPNGLLKFQWIAMGN